MAQVSGFVIHRSCLPVRKSEGSNPSVVISHPWSKFLFLVYFAGGIPVCKIGHIIRSQSGVEGVLLDNRSIWPCRWSYSDGNGEVVVERMRNVDHLFVE